MDHMKHYNKLCESRAKLDRQKGDEYLESHHVFPKSICGDNPVTVLLTAREHYIAHWLIWRAYQNKFGNDNWRTTKMAMAFFRTTSGNPKVRSAVSSRAYQISKEAMAEAKRLQIGPNRTANQLAADKDKIGKIPWNKGKTYKGKSGAKWSEEAKAARSKAATGTGSNRYGTKHTLETKLKMKLARERTIKEKT